MLATWVQTRTSSGLARVSRVDVGERFFLFWIPAAQALPDKSYWTGQVLASKLLGYERVATRGRIWRGERWRR